MVDITVMVYVAPFISKLQSTIPHKALVLLRYDVIVVVEGCSNSLFTVASQVLSRC